MPNNHLAQWLAHIFCSGFLFRQFFPKKMPLHKVTEKELFKATDLMNNQPRKCLGYKTPSMNNIAQNITAMSCKIRSIELIKRMFPVVMFKQVF